MTRRSKVLWNSQQCFRDLVQNLLDALKLQFGQISCSEHSGDSSSSWGFHTDSGDSVGRISCSPGSVQIWQLGGHLRRHHLLLESEKTSESAGGYGEGMKRAGCKLLQEGLSLQYLMQGEVWDWQFDDDGILVVRSSPHHQSEQELTISLRGEGAEQLFNPDILMICQDKHLVTVTR